MSQPQNTLENGSVPQLSNRAQEAAKNMNPIIDAVFAKLFGDQVRKREELDRCILLMLPDLRSILRPIRKG